MNNVKFHKEVVAFLNELVDILFEKEYFGFKDSAKDYVEQLVTEITGTIKNKHKKTAPDYFSKYAHNLYYATYRRNKTTWYVFFYYTRDTYYIRYIGNNYNIGQYL